MADNVSEIQKLYVEYFGRPADPEGLNFWVSAMNQNPNVITQIQHDFATSAEYQANYGGRSNHDVVEAVYHNMFGRAEFVRGQPRASQRMAVAHDAHEAVREQALLVEVRRHEVGIEAECQVDAPVLQAVAQFVRDR